MPANKHKNVKQKESRKAELEALRLRIKKELEEIIEKTEGQNRALKKVIKEKVH